MDSLWILHGFFTAAQRPPHAIHVCALIPSRTSPCVQIYENEYDLFLAPDLNDRCGPLV